ncbi:hypothetical protein SBOR_1371 [Sclerotinia borealis F-4128]|uniref:Sec20 C-terminal domain-containing protein n=1 Tax=Sclerotinia borealis (strain F-4128) TaxID=1432307 RepID=W9CUR8_SCLBF|nr:hypothetical protein SBOR_1371 [Sclerotinia borealis F-4128]
MSFESLSERLATLQESNRQARELIDRLETIEFPPGSIALDSDDDNGLLELSAEITQVLKDQDEEFEQLQEEVLSLPAGRPNSESQRQRQVLDDAVERDIKELKSYYTTFRKAQMTAKKKLKAAQVLARQVLLQASLNPSSGRSSPSSMERPISRQKSEPSKEEKTVNAAGDVTLALRRTHEMMAGELEKSQFANDTLKQSTEKLAQLDETYSTLDSLLSNSRHLLGTLLRSQKSDTWYLESAFYILISTIAWLIFRRFLYGPLWWIVYAPLRLILYTLFGIFGMMGSKGGSVVESSLSISREPVIYSTVSTGSKDATVIDVTNGDQQPTATAASTMVEEVIHIIDESQHYRAPDKEGANVASAGEEPPHDTQLEPEESMARSEQSELSKESARDEPTYDTQIKLEESTARSEQSESEENPKKRMWEEPEGAIKDAPQRKDEL